MAKRRRGEAMERAMGELWRARYAAKQAEADRQRQISDARDRVVEAAKQWAEYERAYGRATGEGLLDAVKALEKLEAENAD